MKRFRSLSAVVLSVLAFFLLARGRAAAAPDKAHIMADVGYHFANLWFAGEKENWPLAAYFLRQTRTNVQWAVEVGPMYKTTTGSEVDLKGIFDSVNNTMLAALDKAIQNKDAAGFQAAYRQTLAGCYACHVAVEKPFLRVQIPEAPPAAIIGFDSGAEPGGVAASHTSPEPDSALE